MRWFRANSIFGGRLALFALAVQFVLSFAHLHPDDIYGPVGLPLSVASPIALPTAQALSSSPRDGAADYTDGFCAICASMYLLGASFVPDVPRLPAPIGVQTVEHFVRLDGVFIAPRRAPFQSRAPPAA